MGGEGAGEKCNYLSRPVSILQCPIKNKAVLRRIRRESVFDRRSNEFIRDIGHCTYTPVFSQELTHLSWSLSQLAQEISGRNMRDPILLRNYLRDCALALTVGLEVENTRERGKEYQSQDCLQKAGEAALASVVLPSAATNRDKQFQEDSTLEAEKPELSHQLYLLLQLTFHS